MKHDTFKGKTYVVTPTADCTVTTESGVVIATCKAGEQKIFVAPAGAVVISDNKALLTEVFKGAALSASGGGEIISFDDAPTAGSLNAVTSNAVFVALQFRGTGGSSLAIGDNAKATTYYTMAFGDGATAASYGANAFGRTATASGQLAVALGNGATASGDSATALGADSKAVASGSVAIGYDAQAKDKDVVAIKAGGKRYSWQSSATQTITQLYLIGADSPLADTCCDGEAGLGYITYQSGRILTCGTIKLSALCTEHTIDSDTPFTPTL